MGAKILVVEDDGGTAETLLNGLRQEGYTVEHVADGRDGLYLASSADFDAVILDRMLPGMDGLSVVKALRAAEVHTPLLILSALGQLDERVRGLRAGGDDYLAKPFSFSELLARVQALLRRSGGAAELTKLKAGDLSIDLLAREVVRGTHKIELQSREFKLLEFLMRNSGKVVSKVMILENIWGYDFDPQTNVVDVLVCRLRDKIDKPFDGKMIQTIRGVGYVLKA
jgi:two-component system OmpR family response regulator